MDKAERLARLEELIGTPEVTNGFPSKQACLSWATQVAPLLNFNPQYHEPFLHYLQIISLPVSSYTAGPGFQNMVNQVHMAIGDLKQQLAASPVVVAPPAVAEEPPKIWKLEPNLYGIGFSLPALWQRAKAKFGKKKKREI